jgi:hypothetical protein
MYSKQHKSEHRICFLNVIMGLYTYRNSNGFILLNGHGFVDSATVLLALFC